MEPSWFAIACGDVPEAAAEERQYSGSKIRRIILLNDADQQCFIETCRDLYFDWEMIANYFHITVPNAVYLWNKYKADWLYL